MRRSLLSLFLLPLSMLLFCGCKADSCNVPFGAAGTIDLSLPEYAGVYNNPGGTLILTAAGHRGILISCFNPSLYVAFECSCPNDPDIRLLPDDDHYALLLSCPECGSRFELTYGNPLEGAATGCPLYQYEVQFDGRYLSIY